MCNMIIKNWFHISQTSCDYFELVASQSHYIMLFHSARTKT